MKQQLNLYEECSPTSADSLNKAATALATTLVATTFYLQVLGGQDGGIVVGEL